MTAIMMWKKNRNVVADDEYINFSMTFTPIIMKMILSTKEIREQYNYRYGWYKKFNEIQRRYFLI